MDEQWVIELLASRDDPEQIIASARECAETHNGHQYPFCESFGCMSVIPLADALATARALNTTLVAALNEAELTLADVRRAARWNIGTGFTETAVLDHALDVARAAIAAAQTQEAGDGEG